MLVTSLRLRINFFLLIKKKKKNVGYHLFHNYKSKHSCNLTKILCHVNSLDLDFHPSQQQNQKILTNL